MCGINGICNSRENPIENICRMNDRIIHRGPDRGDYWISDDGKVALGHRRLSIIDLSSAGNQPMFSHNRHYVLVFNGEIYNFKDVLKKMRTDGYSDPMRGNSDTEVLAEAVSFYGVDKTLTMIRGMYAFAVYDLSDGTLYLARDRMGEKPLYYGKVGGQFVFASDVESVCAVKGFQNEIDENVLALYFRYGYIPQPYSIYKQIWKLPSGGLLKIKAPYTDWESSLYWDIREVAKRGLENPFSGTEQEAAEELERLLKETIREQMVADVPLGAFLSGGTDSTAVVSLMQAVSDQNVHTFTIGFEETGYNEAVFAKEEARHLGTQHAELYVGFRDVMEILPVLGKAYSEPFADSSQIPTMLVSRLAKKDVTVSVSGDGGDEIFCGYNTYQSLRKGLQITKGKAGFIPKNLRKSIGKLCLNCGGNWSPLLYKAGNVFSVDTPEDYKRVLAEHDYRISRISKKKRLLCSDDWYSDGLLNHPEENLMLMDMLQYLPDDILVKVDRAGMYYSLENRIPFLDKRIVEFAWTLPLEYKFSEGKTKRVLKNILYQYIPEKMMERPKTGFGIPISEWLREGEMKEWARSLMRDAEPFAKEFLNLKTVNAIWDRLQEKNIWLSNIWYILMFEQWLLTRNAL